MNKNLLLAILGCFAISIGTVALLFAMSGQKKSRQNSFLRQFPPHPVMEGEILKLKHNSYYIAGGTPHTVYLGNYTAPLHVIEVNLDRLDTQEVKLDVKGVMDQKFWAAKVQVDSPNFYLTDGAVPIIFEGDVNGWHAEKRLADSVYFLDIVPTGNSSFAVKSLSGATGENILGKITPRPPHQKFETGILQKQLDGVFCTNGMMRFDKELNRLVYLYYYRNQFMVMDTSLNLLYRGNTIDTTSKARIKPTTIESSGTMTMASAPFFVNRSFDVSGKWLFVNSNLLAKNEPIAAFNEGAVIDVYGLEDGKYTFSFYIYHIDLTNRMIGFRVFGNKMVVLYDKLIRVFDLRAKFFRPDEPGKNESRSFKNILCAQDQETVNRIPV